MESKAIMNQSLRGAVDPSTGMSYLQNQIQPDKRGYDGEKV